jgi:hypothetical protein
MSNIYRINIYILILSFVVSLLVILRVEYLGYLITGFGFIGANMILYVCFHKLLKENILFNIFQFFFGIGFSLSFPLMILNFNELMLDGLAPLRSLFGEHDIFTVLNASTKSIVMYISFALGIILFKKIFKISDTNYINLRKNTHFIKMTVLFVLYFILVVMLARVYGIGNSILEINQSVPFKLGGFIRFSSFILIPLFGYFIFEQLMNVNIRYAKRFFTLMVVAGLVISLVIASKFPIFSFAIIPFLYYLSKMKINARFLIASILMILIAGLFMKILTLFRIYTIDTGSIDLYSFLNNFQVADISISLLSIMINPIEVFVGRIGGIVEVMAISHNETNSLWVYLKSTDFIYKDIDISEIFFKFYASGSIRFTLAMKMLGAMATNNYFFMIIFSFFWAFVLSFIFNLIKIHGMRFMLGMAIFIILWDQTFIYSYKFTFVSILFYFIFKGLFFYRKFYFHNGRIKFRNLAIK